jgi:hypothetical protein
VVVAVTTGKSCKFSLNEWLPTIDTLRMDVWCCFSECTAYHMVLMAILELFPWNSLSIWGIMLCCELPMIACWLSNPLSCATSQSSECQLVIWGLLFCSRSPPQRYRSRSPDYRPYNGH